MKTRYEMTKLFSVEKDFDGSIKVIAGNTTKTYNDLPISTVSFLFGLSEYVARSAELFEKYAGPERENEFSDNMLTTADRIEKNYRAFPSSTHTIQIGGGAEVSKTSVDVAISRIEFAFALAIDDSKRTFDAIIHDIAVKKLINVIK
mgnify:FL=1